eukprot:444933-Amphidinium_carterae.1
MTAQVPLVPLDKSKLSLPFAGSHAATVWDMLGAETARALELSNELRLAVLPADCAAQRLEES